MRRSLGIAEEARVITTIGALHPRKSHHLFLEATVKVSREFPDLRALVVGEGLQEAELRRRAATLGIAGVVQFTGLRSDIPAILSATDVYVKPGIVEGFIGITVLEAMAARIPVVAFDTRDVRAAVVDGQTGLIVPREDTGALASAIMGLLRDPTRARALADRGYERVAERFSLRAVAAGLERAYRSAP